jgi:hypothetical protein
MPNCAFCFISHQASVVKKHTKIVFSILAMRENRNKISMLDAGCIQ